MALKAIVTNDEYSKLPDGIKGEYVKLDDGRMRLDVHPVDGWNLEDVGGLKSAYGKVTGTAKTLESEVAAYRELGMSAADLKEAVAKVKNLPNMTPSEKVDELKVQLEKQWLEKYEGKDGLLTKERTAREQALRSLEKLTVQDALRAALIAEGAEEDSIEIAVDYARKYVKAEPNGKGEYAAVVYGPDGEPRISPTPGQRGNMTVAELAKELKSQKGPDRFFRGTGISGGGMRPGATGGAGGANGRFTITESEARSNPGKYSQLRDAAEKAGTPNAVEIVPG